MSTRGLAFSVFWLILANLISFFFTGQILKNEKKYKQELTKEWAVINRENEKFNLIESMGLTPQYKAKQEQVSQANEKLLIGKFNHIKALNKTIPINLIIGIFPFLFLLVVQQFFEVTQNILLI